MNINKQLVIKVQSIKTSMSKALGCFLAGSASVLAIAGGVALTVASGGTMVVAGKALIGSGVSGVIDVVEQANNDKEKFETQSLLINVVVGAGTSLVFSGASSVLSKTASVSKTVAQETVKAVVKEEAKEITKVAVKDVFKKEFVRQCIADPVAKEVAKQGVLAGAGAFVARKGFQVYKVHGIPLAELKAMI
jgi:hypothetical protein